MLKGRFYFLKDIKTQKYIETQQKKKQRLKNQKLIIEQNDTVLNINFGNNFFFLNYICTIDANKLTSKNRVEWLFNCKP